MGQGPSVTGKTAASEAPTQGLSDALAAGQEWDQFTSSEGRFEIKIDVHV